MKYKVDVDRIADIPGAYDIKEKDWVIVTGKFAYVTRDNTVVLYAKKIKNEGYSR